MSEQASSWMVRFTPLIRPSGTVLDLACGRGRNVRWLAERGWQVEAVDRDKDALASLQGLPNVTTLQADLEGAPWPYADRRFDAIIVCRYLHRPLFKAISSCLSENGMLLYETFMCGHEQFGRPSNPDFLLQPDELLHVFSPELQIIAFEQGRFDTPSPAILQRICARNMIR